MHVTTVREIRTIRYKSYTHRPLYEIADNREAEDNTLYDLAYSEVNQHPIFPLCFMIRLTAPFTGTSLKQRASKRVSQLKSAVRYENRLR